MKIGKVISVEYDKFRVKLLHSTKTSIISIDGQVYFFGNIGSFLKVYNPTGESIICEVIAIMDRTVDSQLFSNYDLDSSRELIVKPIGTLNKFDQFKMGVGIFPSIYSDVHIVTKNDIELVLNSVLDDQLKDDSTAIHRNIEIGISRNMLNYKIELNINKLFNIHTAILGNSGSGKSNTIAHLFQEVLRKSHNSALGAKFILFDVNGEYQGALKKGLNEKVELANLKPNTTSDITPFHLPYYLLTQDEWLAFLMASDRTQKPFWDKVLQECFKFYKIFQKDSKLDFTNYFKWKFRTIFKNLISYSDSDTSKITAARGVVIKCREITQGYKNKDLTEFLNELESKCNLNYGNNQDELSSFLSELEIDEQEAFQIEDLRLTPGEYFDHNFLKTAVELVLLDEEAKGNSRIREFTSTMLSRLNYFLTHPDCDFMREGDSYKNTQDYLQSVFNVGDKKVQLILVDLSEVGNDILELSTSVISRMFYDLRKSKNGEERLKSPVHIILDEAHRYIKKDAEYILRENIFERIAREGRKFSLFLMLSSQRPSELSPTVLSQCGNYIIHRIQNELDMKYIYSVLPYYSDDYTTKVKQQVPGEALIFGNCVPMPLHVKITQAKPAPHSENVNISQEWFTK